MVPTSCHDYQVKVNKPKIISISHLCLHKEQFIQKIWSKSFFSPPFRTLGYKNRYVRVPDGHFWIEGDHHGHSLDSNSFGPVWAAPACAVTQHPAHQHLSTHTIKLKVQVTSCLCCITASEALHIKKKATVTIVTDVIISKTCLFQERCPLYSARFKRGSFSTH